MTRETTVSLTDRVEEIEERLEEIEGEQQEIVEEAQEYESDEETIPDDLEEKFDRLEGERVELEGEHEIFQDTIEEWDGAEFTITALMYGQVQNISDEVMSESFEVNFQNEDVSGAPRNGYYEILILRESVKSSPPGAPDDPANYPPGIGEYLYNKVNAFNTTGETEMGNTSLRERMDNN